MGTLERIRWGNLARLGLVIAAGLLIAIGPRGCGKRQPAAPPPPRALPGAPAQPAPVHKEQSGRLARRPRKRNRRRKRPRQESALRPIQPTADSRLPTKPPAQTPRPNPTAPPKPRGAPGEFF
jgi:hypothetical protein